MTMHSTKNILAFVLMVCLGLFTACASTQNAQKAPTEKNDKKEKNEEGFKPYDEVITDEAITDEGLFTVHQVDDKYYFEIPDSLLGDEILLVSRVAKTMNNLAYGGSKINTQTIRWQRREDDILLRHVSYENVASDSVPVFRAVRRSNFEPVLAAFDIKTIGEDSASVVIDVTELFTSDIPSLTLPRSVRERFGVRRLDDDRTFINSIKSYPENIEVRNLLTYEATKPPSSSAAGTISVVMNHSMVLLPYREEKMRPRAFDSRVGYFSVSMTNYSTDAQKAEPLRYITRYQLVPKDKQAYLNGELVEPVDPIVYYIDRATPEKWRKYMIDGIEMWNEAFEEAGFKNAIIGKLAPDDSTFNPESSKYSTIRYFASPVQNAYGPHVHDPRTGEILESDIGWYHNVQTLLRHWYFVQTAAANPKARGVTYPTELMGQLIKFVAAHEVGHTLGLQHNMGSSNAYPVDSLRSPSFTSTHGTAPSIMDYARFNYIAQPGDGVTNFMPDIGEYDKWAIKWGYTWFPSSMNSEEIERTLDKWIAEHDSAIYHWGVNALDPRSNTEDLGRNGVKASKLGIKNLKVIMDHLVEWTAQPYKDFSELEERYNAVISQYRRYLGHVSAVIGGVYEYDRTYSEQGPVYVFVDEAEQRDALNFLIEYSLETPKWLLDEDVLELINQDKVVDSMRELQVGVLNGLLDPQLIARFIEYNTRYDKDTFTAYELLDEVRNGVWSELDNYEPINVFRRNLQRAYVERMEYLMTEELPDIPERFKDFIGWTDVDVSQSDIRPIVRDQLEKLLDDVQQAQGRIDDRISEAHLNSVEVRIEDILNPDD